MRSMAIRVALFRIFSFVDDYLTAKSIMKTARFLKILMEILNFRRSKFATIDLVLPWLVKNSIAE